MLEREARYRIGIDENGLGPRLGPLVVTGVLAELDEKGQTRIRRKLPARLRADLGDSKTLVSTRNIALGEAWARSLVEATSGKEVKTPRGLLNRLSLQTNKSLRADCPPSTEGQCFFVQGEHFSAPDELMQRIRAQVPRLLALGISVKDVKSEIVCTGKLNDLKARGIHRFTADLHAMERLVLSMRHGVPDPVLAVCGKVGGITRYEPFFGPLAGRLHTVLGEERAKSAYHFPQLGELRFLRDADASDPLVMLSSLVGKYIRELLMARISRFYASHVPDLELPSGYHDPVTGRFIQRTRAARQKLEIVGTCFERLGAK